MTVCGNKATGVCVMGKCPYFKLCNKVVWDKTPHKQPTNFQRITQDEDTLARWLDSTFYTCDAGCSHCALKEKCLSEEKGYQGSAMWREWLKQEHT